MSMRDKFWMWGYTMEQAVAELKRLKGGKPHA